MGRSDWQHSVKFPVGYLPGGSANALATCLDASTPELAALAFIAGDPRPLDLMLVSYSDGRKYASHLMVAWTLIADVDIESERFRWAGPLRFDVSAITRVLDMRKYLGRIYYLEQDDNAPAGYRSETAYPQVLQGTPPSDWTEFNGTFTIFLATNLSHVAPDFCAAPEAKFNDGYIHLSWVEEKSFGTYLSILKDKETGKHLENEAVNYKKVKALVLEPGARLKKTGADDSNKGILDVDGEKVDCDRVLIETMPAAALVIAPKWLQ